MENLISINEFCFHHKVDFSLIRSFEEFGLIKIVSVDDFPFIHSDQLSELEKLMRLHDLDINTEGIEAIVHLLERVNQMQEKIRLLENKLRFYESID